MHKFLTAILGVCVSCLLFASNHQASFDEDIDDFDGKTSLLPTKSIAQDGDGTIWFGTSKGLYSFDGYRIKSHSAGLMFVQIYTVAVSGRTVHLGTNNGLYAYSMDSGEYTSVTYFDKDQVRALTIHDDVMYVGAASGLYAYRWLEKETASSVTRLCAEEIFSLAAGKDNLWVGSTNGFGEYSFATGRYHGVDTDLYPGMYPINVVPSLYEENDSTLWVGTPSHLVKCDPRDMSTRIVAGVSVVKSITKKSDGCFYIGTDNGLVEFTSGDGKVTKIGDIIVNSSFTDRNGDIWLATDTGLMLHRHSRILHTLDTSSSPAESVFSTMVMDKSGNLWAGGSKGISLYRTLPGGGYGFERRYTMEDNEWNIPHNRVSRITEDKADGTILVASDAGYLRLDSATGKFTSYRVTDTYNWFYDVILDGNYMWLASYDGLVCLDGNGSSSIFTVQNGLSVNDISHIAKDRSGKIWILTRDGNVFNLNPQNRTIEKFNLSAYLTTSHASCLSCDMEGTIWICSGSRILHINDYAPENKISVLDIDNLSTMEPYSIQDLDGRMWICTSEGVYILDKQSGKIDCINSGMQYVTVCYDIRNDIILLGGPGRISFFKVSDLGKLTGDERLPVKITSITVNGKQEMDAETVRSGMVRLSSHQNNLSVSFSDYNFNSDIPRRYNFSINGNKSSWNEVASDNTIVLPDLKPGRYTLSISPGNSNSYTDNATDILSIIISHPWYFSYPMLLLYLLLLGALAFGIIKFFTVKKGLDLEREQKEVLISQTKEKEAFFGNIAHEFKTPLSMIIAPLSKYINDNDGAGENEMLRIALDNANKLNALARNTIDYYRDKSDSASDLILSEVETVEFARSIFSSFKDAHPDKEFIFDSTEPRIYADIDVVKMEAVLNNLISNACKYTPDGGSVILTMERDKVQDRLIIKLSDTGIGIPENELNLVFQRYYESSRSKGGHYDSTGIGLSIIKKNVESHKGSVNVSSDENGTTFTVILPCKKEKDDEAQSRNALQDESDKPLVVIVEDNSQVCTFLERLFSDKYKCISSGNGKSGLKLCKDVMPDLIISDVMMPVMDGLEMCRQIREYTPLATIPIILLTAKSDSETEKRSIALGIDSFMPKPFDFATLSARVDQLLANKTRMEQKIRMEMVAKPQDKHELSYDEKYLKKVTEIIEEHLDDSDLSVATLCEYGNFNDKQLYRKIKQFTGLSTVEYIRSIRLKKAAILLQNGNFTISEVMYSVGFSNASYFTRAFSAEYGKTPTEYMKSYKKS